MFIIEVSNADGSETIFEYDNEMTYERVIQLMTRSANRVTTIRTYHEVVKDRTPERMAG